MKGYVILAVLVNHRNEVAVEVQEVLTKFGCIIKLRLGLHETTNVCAEDALVLLQLDGSKEEITNLQESLNIIDGVETKLISLGN